MEFSRSNEDFVCYQLWSEDIVENPLFARSKYLNYLSQYTSEYLWNNVNFTLSLDVRANEPSLKGNIHFGENIQDEWFVVFLMVELSKKFSGLIVKVTDNDGEFLLIEAAEHLPRWIKPEIMENRVFIFDGNLHIIPLPSTPAELQHLPSSQSLSLSSALSIIKNKKVNTKADNHIQECINNRIKIFPSKIKEDKHSVKCYLPLQLVFLILKNPLLLSKAINTYYNRDIDTIQHLKRMDKFGECEHVLSMISMNRFLYAILNRQKMDVLPSKLQKQYSSVPDNKKWLKAIDLGAKLTCGFEILYQESKLESMNKDDVTTNVLTEFEKYIISNNIKVSEEDIQSYIEKEIIFKGESTAESIDKILKDYDKQTKESLDTSLVTIDKEDDDDEWMSISEKDLDLLLQERQELNTVKSGKKDIKNSNPLQNFISQMSSFMEKESDYEGVEPDNDSINFDPNKFLSVMKSTLGIIEEEDDNDKEYSDSEEDIESFVEDDKLLQVMTEMDRELDSRPDINKDNDDSDLTLNFNMVKNLLDSYSAQFGTSGPVSNILSEL